MKLEHTIEGFIISFEKPLEHHLTVSLDAAQFATVLQLFTTSQTTIERKLEEIMSAFATLTAAQQQEHNDLATLATLLQQLLAAFANGTMTAAQASALLTEMNAEDSTIQTNIASIQTALAPPPATPATPATPTA